MKPSVRRDWLPKESREEQNSKTEHLGKPIFKERPQRRSWTGVKEAFWKVERKAGEQCPEKQEKSGQEWQILVEERWEVKNVF